MKFNMITLLMLLLVVIKGEVTQINDANFNSQVVGNGQQMWMVMFGADWCGHCKHLKPQFEKASNQMSDYGLKFGYVNEKDNRNLISKYVVDPATHMVSYPKVFVILGDEVLGQLPGQNRNSHAIKFWFDNTFSTKEAKTEL